MNINPHERRNAWLMLILCPLSMMIVFVYVTLGDPKGLIAGHPREYLQATCVMWALVFMIIPVLRLLRIIALPRWLVVLLYVNMYIYVLSLIDGMYLDVAWWGYVSHVIAGMVVAAIVFVALCLMKAHSPAHISFGSKGSIIALMMFIASSFGVIWEIAEGLTDILSGTDYMQYGIIDTLGDLISDLIGVFMMMAIAWLVLRKQDVDKVASTVRIGKKYIDAGE